MRSEKEAFVINAMLSMTDRQKDYFLRYLRRMSDDPEFFSRMEREGAIFRSLFAAEDYQALDRWLMHRRLTVVTSPGAQNE